MSDSISQTQADQDAIREHVISLFDAYLAGDLETLRSGRTEDWKGFQIRSTRLVHGIDDYMTELEKVIGGLKVDRYEFLDFEVEVDNDLGIVYYLARDYLSDDLETGKASAPKTVLIRSIDIYRRINGSWIQVGSNICAISDPSTDGERPGRR
jgi:ketosteroid isomerase-like protein